MGKTTELLGLAAFNVVIAMILSSLFLTTASEHAVGRLTEANVEKFITEVAEVSGGLREDMDDYSVTSYFMKHIADESTFKSKIEYIMPDTPANERFLEMDKLNFITHILQDQQSMDRYESAVEIEFIEIADSGKKAKVMTTNYERGIMPISDIYGESRMMPVTGTSYCEQELIIGKNNLIQMSGADCNTNIDFSETY